jgi:N-acylneuraminate cytidylyltransferase
LLNLAVIPARGGSQRIPGKNIKDFCGKPLIAYSIEAAIESGCFDHIIVSTDSQDIADIAIQYGADTPFMRPPELSDNYTGTTPVVCHAIQEVSKRYGKPDFTCCIYATAPFIQNKDLARAFALLSEQCDKAYAFSVTTFDFPIQRAIRLKEGGVEPIESLNMGKRSQDLEEAYHDAGQFYWGRSDAFLSGKSTFATHSIPVVLPRYLVQDIDTPEDWKRAELMYNAYSRTTV